MPITPASNNTVVNQNPIVYTDLQRKLIVSSKVAVVALEIITGFAGLLLFTQLIPNPFIHGPISGGYILGCFGGSFGYIGTKINVIALHLIEPNFASEIRDGLGLRKIFICTTNERWSNLTDTVEYLAKGALFHAIAIVSGGAIGGLIATTIRHIENPLVQFAIPIGILGTIGMIFYSLHSTNPRPIVFHFRRNE